MVSGLLIRVFDHTQLKFATPLAMGIDDGDEDKLYEINLNTGEPLSTTTITLSGFIVEKGLGITANPTTGVLYALLKVQGSSTRKLVTIDPTTGVATLIGDANDASGHARISSIAFHPADPNC